jgi:hypothetical protein
MRGDQTWYVVVTSSGVLLSYAGKVVLFPSEEAADIWRIGGDVVRAWSDDRGASV